MIIIRNEDGSIGPSAGGQYEDGAPAQLGPVSASYAPTVAPVLIESPVTAPPESGVVVIPSGNAVGGRGITLDAPPEPESGAADGGAQVPAPGTVSTPRVVPTSAGVVEGGPVATRAVAVPPSRTRMLWASAAIVGGIFVLVALSRRGSR